MTRRYIHKIYRKLIKSILYIDKILFGKDIAVNTYEWPHEKPFISVIIPCFNYGRYINETIESVLLQTYDNLEIIIVDGGSTDRETITTLQSITHSKVKVFFREGLHLAGDNRNFGIAHALGKYICCLDADDKLHATYLEKSVFYAESGNLSIVYPWVQCFEEKEDIWAPGEPDLYSCAMGATIPTIALFRKNDWELVGGFRDWGIGKEHVPEDWDFWTRMLGHGCQIKVLPEPLMFYRVHGEGLTAQNRMSLSNQRDKLISANRKLFSRSNRALIRKRRRERYIVNNPFVNLLKKDTGKVNVLLALPFMVTGGADEVLLRILGHLSQKNFAFSCITTLPTDAKFSGDNSPRYEQITREVYHLHKFIPGKQEKKDFIFYLIETKLIDIIFIVGCSFMYQMSTEIKAKYPHVKIVDQLFNPFGHIINNRRYAKQIDLNIVANEGIEKILISKFREKKEKISVIIHGVDVHREFSPEIFSSKYPRNPSWKLRPDDFVIGYFGRFSKEKGPAKFVDIAVKLRGLGGITWVMTGGGGEFAGVRALIERRGMGNSILTMGIVDDVKPFLAAAHVVVIPSIIEGIPIVLLEAMSLGIPVVASCIGGIPEIITDGHNGFLCASSDIDGFSSRIKILYNDRNLWGKMGKNARAYALHHLDLSNMLEAYHQAFINVINQRRGVEHEA